MSVKDTDLTGLFKSDRPEEGAKFPTRAEMAGAWEEFDSAYERGRRAMVTKEQIDAVVAVARREVVLSRKGPVIVHLADENDRLRDDLTVADDALKLAREAHQVTIDAENRLRAVKCESCTDATPRLCLSCADFDVRTLRAQLAEAVALLESAPIGGSDAEILAWAWVKLRGAL